MLLPRLDNDYDLQEHPIPPLSLETELRVLELLHRLSSEQLARYPTTLEEDHERYAARGRGAGHARLPRR